MRHLPLIALILTAIANPALAAQHVPAKKMSLKDHVITQVLKLSAGGALLFSSCASDPAPKTYEYKPGVPLNRGYHTVETIDGPYSQPRVVVEKDAPPVEKSGSLHGSFEGL